MNAAPPSLRPRIDQRIDMAKAGLKHVIDALVLLV